MQENDIYSKEGLEYGYEHYIGNYCIIYYL